MRTLIACALLALMSGCDLVTGGSFVEVTSEDDAAARVVALKNETGSPVYFFIGEEDDIARTDLDLSMITNGPAVAAGETVRVSYEDIHFYDPGDTRGWIYWTTGEGDGETLRVTLRP